MRGILDDAHLHRAAVALPQPGPPSPTIRNNPAMTALAWAGAVAMDYRRQVTMRRDGDDSVVATYADGLIIFRNKDAAALRKLCRSLRWEIVRDTTASDDGRTGAPGPWCRPNPSRQKPKPNSPMQTSPLEAHRRFRSLPTSTVAVMPATRRTPSGT
jgi:hypothetical protein